VKHAVPISPTGEQIAISSGDQRVVITEVGAGLRSYTLGDRPILDAYGESEVASAGRGQVLMPWPNRLQDGAYEFAGKSHQLALTEPEAGNAIHGLVRWAAWSVGDRDADRVVMEHTLHPHPGYPFALALSIEYSLSEDGLRVTSTAANVGGDPCPYGSGQHPYLTVGTEKVDTVVLHVPGRTMLLTDERKIPVAAAPVEGTEHDFRQPRAIGAQQLDNTFTDLIRDDDGLARVTLRDPDGDAEVTVWLDESYPYVEVFTGDPLPSVERRSLAVEPMTCPPNAFRTGEGILVLAPGESATAAWGIQPRARKRATVFRRPASWLWLRSHG
jgi:aldose 1-epimerase